VEVANTGDRPIQLGSHYHFAEANPALVFDRDKTRGYRLDVAAGTAIRFEPGQTREVTLIPFVGKREIYGKVVVGAKLNGPVAGVGHLHGDTLATRAQLDITLL